MERLEEQTPDLIKENIDKLVELFPDVLTETLDENGEVRRAIDFDALREDLSDIAVEGKRERYQFTWPGKARAKLEARTPCNKTMRPVPEKSVDWDTTQNLYIEGDNLEALKVMRETYAGKVKLIYIDPPYNTGHDFIYDDDFSQTQAEYAEQSGEYDEEGGRLVANLESNGRFHSDWCSMMYPRLLLARDMLTSDGAIFISIDDNEEANLTKICDEIFGKSNFIAKFAVQVNPRGRNLDLFVAKTYEPVLVYARNYSNRDTINPLDKDDRMLAEYNQQDEKGRYRLLGLRNRNQRFNPQTRPNLYFPLWIDPNSGDVALEQDSAHSIERLPHASDGAPTCWTWSRDKIRKEKDYLVGLPSGEGWRVFRKDYLDEGGASKTLAKSLQIEAEFNNDYGKRRIRELFGASIMSFPKSHLLIKRIVEMGSKPGDLVMDFFSGSATTADAVLLQNLSTEEAARRFIMIQLPEPCEENTEAAKAGCNTICDIGEERIRRAGKKILQELQESNRQLKLGEEPKQLPDVGFRVLRVDESCLKDTYAAPAAYTQASLDDLIDNMNEDADGLALLFQVLPKFRIPYSARIETREIAGKTVYAVEGNMLLACFDEEVSTEAVEAIAKEKPFYAVFRDASMKDDATVANLEELFKTFSPDTIRRVI